MTVTGAVMVFSRLASAKAGFNLALASGDLIKVNRAGLQLALVGAHLT